MAKLSSYQDLRVWQAGMDLAESCYRLTQGFPADERFGMTSQIRRASASIPANIAEGYGRANRKEYVQFLWIAHGSLKELETHLLLSKRVGLGKPSDLETLVLACADTGRMLASLIRSLSSTSRHPSD